MANKFYHSVKLDEEKCKGCINCIKRCPTEAIRVRNGKACINNKFCIDCGVCIRICENHAKLAVVDHLADMDRYEYRIALPAPTLYSQFNNLDDRNIILNALMEMGFDDVYEVSAASVLGREATRKFLAEHKEGQPWISTACPTIVRLIRVRFPNLIEHLLPIKPPVEVAAELAVKHAMEKTGLPREKIGVVFISPCPSKNTYAKSPLGTEKSEIDMVVGIKEIYPKLLSSMKIVAQKPDLPDLTKAGRIGISWGFSGGEAGGALCDSYLAADGIEDSIGVLEDLEDQKIETLEFVELDACHGGCVGGVLAVENPYLSVARFHRMRRYLPIQLSHINEDELGDQEQQKAYLSFDNEIKYEPVFNLGDSLIEGFVRLNQAERLEKKFPGLDCGSCGAPTCKALAMDIVRGEATEDQCIYLMRSHISEMASELQSASREAKRTQAAGGKGNYEHVEAYIDKIANDLSRMAKTSGVGYKGVNDEG